MYYVFIGIFGLIIGSFLNAVIYRLKSGDSIVKSRSKCTHCQRQLKAKDLVPLFSWLALKGKCRFCNDKISWQYPAVEFITALLFIIGYLILVTDFSTFIILNYIFYLIAISFLIVIFVFDHLHQLILDKVTIPLMVIAIIFIFVLRLNWTEHVLAGIAGGAWFGWQYILSKGKWIGGGDIRLGIIMGLLLGFPGVIVALFLAYILGAIVGVYLLATKKRDRGSQIAFGTFLSLSTVVTWLCGDQLLDWYLGLFNFL
ncbi:prepilin peptidase [Patescibacteria group bacterium]|nr:prepilin peptidase [Patescibacteria group bacterium]